MYPEPGRQLLSSSEKTALKRLEKSGYIQVCKKGNRQSEHQRSGIKLRNLAFYSMGKCKPLGSLNSFLSSATQISGTNPLSLFTLHLAFSQFLSDGDAGQGMAASTGSQFWEPSFTFGGQKSVTFLVD